MLRLSVSRLKTISPLTGEWLSDDAPGQTGKATGGGYPRMAAARELWTSPNEQSTG